MVAKWINLRFYHFPRTTPWLVWSRSFWYLELLLYLSIRIMWALLMNTLDTLGFVFSSTVLKFLGSENFYDPHLFQVGSNFFDPIMHMSSSLQHSPFFPYSTHDLSTVLFAHSRTKWGWVRLSSYSWQHLCPNVPLIFWAEVDSTAVLLIITHSRALALGISHPIWVPFVTPHSLALVTQPSQSSTLPQSAVCPYSSTFPCFSC